MKNYFLTIILLVIFSSITSAQFNTGSKMVGASSYLDFGFSTEKAEGSEFASKIISININPRAAYFVQNRFAVGGDLGCYFHRYKEGDFDPSTTTTLLIGPFTRYYYKSIAWIRPFGEFKLGAGTTADRYIYTGEEFVTRHMILYTGGGVGAAFFLAENFALEGMLSYTYEYQKNTETDVSHNYHDVWLSFGFTFFFNSLLQE